MVERDISRQLVHAQDMLLTAASAIDIAHGANFPADLLCSLKDRQNNCDDVLKD